MSCTIAIGLMDRLEKIISIIRYLKEEGMAAAAVTPTNNAGPNGLGFDPKTQTPPVFRKKRYAYLGPGSRVRWMLTRKPPVA